MKKLIIFYLIFLMASFQANSQRTLYLTSNSTTKTATLTDNKAVEELVSLLEEGPLTISMTDNGGFEKIGTLPHSLPTSDERQTAEVGDIMLYVGDVLCIFYGPNTWAYTKLGKIDNMNSEEIKAFLSGNPVSLTLSIDDEASVKETNDMKLKESGIYNLNGQPVAKGHLKEGIYIMEGKKRLIK